MKKSKNIFSKTSLMVAPKLVALILTIVVLIFCFIYYEYSRKNKDVPPVIPTHSNSASSKPAVSPTNNSSSATDNSPASQPINIEHTLITPFGNFISNHNPGQNGSPTAEASVCNTTPGANCYIKFVNIDNNQSTQLPSQVTDARGSTSWYWDIKNDAHLTSGRWQVTAISTLGDQTKSTTDTLNLNIQ